MASHLNSMGEDYSYYHSKISWNIVRLTPFMDEARQLGKLKAEPNN